MGHARRSMNYVCSIAALFSQILPLEPAFCKAAPKLAFNDGGTFKILQLADLHYGHFPETDERTDKVKPPPFNHDERVHGEELSGTHAAKLCTPFTVGHARVSIKQPSPLPKPSATFTGDCRSSGI